MISKEYKRCFRDDRDARAKALLDALLVSDISAKEYQQVMYSIGMHLGNTMSNVALADKTYCVVATAEDADYLAKGIIESLSKKVKGIYLVCLWNQRSNVNGSSVAPIYNRFYEPGYENADEFIIVKSIISGSCVVKTNITEIYEHVKPQAIHIVAPVMHVQSEDKLRIEFPEQISSKFDFTYFAKDYDRDESSGEIIPGIGGDVYQRLGFRDQSEKNTYFPEIVMQRMMATA